MRVPHESATTVGAPKPHERRLRAEEADEPKNSEPRADVPQCPRQHSRHGHERQIQPSAASRRESEQTHEARDTFLTRRGLRMA